MTVINHISRLASLVFYDELGLDKKKTEGDAPEAEGDGPLTPEDIDDTVPYKGTFNWNRLFFFSSYHVLGVFGLIRCFTSYKAFYVGVYTLAFSWFLARITTMVSHRLFSHRAFKVTETFKKVLIILQTMTTQNSCWTWARDHRIHHKYSDTHGDPHNSRRGFWFSHVGWCVMERHPAVLKAEREVDMSDLEADSWIRLQYKYLLPLHFVVGLVLPVALPFYTIHDDFWDCFLIAYFLRTVLVWHAIWCVNSWAHMHGNKPYHVGLQPAETSLVSTLSGGEGWHNFHHSFPFDYRAGEITNDTTTFIELAARMGWAYGLRKATDDMILRRAEAHGDGSRTAHLRKYGMLRKDG